MAMGWDGMGWGEGGVGWDWMSWVGMGWDGIGWYRGWMAWCGTDTGMARCGIPGGTKASQKAYDTLSSNSPSASATGHAEARSGGGERGKRIGTTHRLGEGTT